MIRISVAVLSFVFSCFTFAAGAPPPKIYIDKSACPYECCTYRKWDVLKDTDLYDGVNGKKMKTQAKAGTKITAMTGEVHTEPLKIKDRDGKEIYLLTYEGEGTWTTWQDGAVVNGVQQNWSTDKTPKSDWWIQVKTPNFEAVGWTKESKNFSDPVGCESAPEGESEKPEETAATKVVPVAPESSLVCNLGVTGIEDKAAFIKFFSELKTAFASKDQDAIGKVMLFPFKVNGDKRYSVKDMAEFKKKFNSIFTKKITDAVVSQDIGNLFCRDQGVMIGSGQVWITQRKDKIGVYVINP